MKPDPLPRSAYRFAHRITTRWSDNDVYGHVNNALYYSFFDTTITSYLLTRGDLLMSVSGPMLFVVASDCAYFRGFAFPETVESGLAISAIGARSVTWRIGLFGEGEDAPRAQGRFVHACVDRTTQRPRAWPAEWVETFEAIRAQTD
ncbi:thioesterase family protein [Methylopila sp. M107]|uniref:acyl-CoA thioesterase n=1 Tax=Methylopila sp. M107 TaxID=1101190 RepID=UPI00036272FA|nr:thioesterase family protein [Methylopila sp. M107]